VLDGPLEVTTLFWNVHWQCSVAASGASGACKDRAASALVDLVRGAKARIVATVELSDGMSSPVDLSTRGLDDWAHAGGSCEPPGGGGGDSAALAFAPEWQVLSSGGGCLRSDFDTRAFAVARVAPPAPVAGCASLCVVAIHAPHSEITKGDEEVARVCGDSVQRCTVAMGDWNVPASGVAPLWSALIGGDLPNLAVPDERTCCFPESTHYGEFDHLVTNIPGTKDLGFEVMPYQILEENPQQQHKPVSVRIALPAAGR